MPAYLVVEHKITDAAKFEQYRVAVGPMIAKHGGRYLTKGGSHKFPEGGHWLPEAVGHQNGDGFSLTAVSRRTDRWCSDTVNGTLTAAHSPVMLTDMVTWSWSR